jgi:hypothetical protein
MLAAILMNYSIWLFALLALWAGWNGLRGWAVTPNYMATLLLGEGTILLAALLHMVLPGMHSLGAGRWLALLYAAVALCAVPCAWALSQPWTQRARAGATILGCLFTCAMLVRVLETGF